MALALGVAVLIVALLFAPRDGTAKSPIKFDESRPTLQTLARRFLGKHDSNGDGKLSDKELISTLTDTTLGNAKSLTKEIHRSASGRRKSLKTTGNGNPLGQGDTGSDSIAKEVEAIGQSLARRAAVQLQAAPFPDATQGLGEQDPASATTGRSRYSNSGLLSASSPTHREQSGSAHQSVTVAGVTAHWQRLGQAFPPTALERWVRYGLGAGATADAVARARFRGSDLPTLASSPSLAIRGLAMAGSPTEEAKRLLRHAGWHVAGLLSRPSPPTPPVCHSAMASSPGTGLASVRACSASAPPAASAVAALLAAKAFESSAYRGRQRAVVQVLRDAGGLELRWDGPVTAESAVGDVHDDKLLTPVARFRVAGRPVALVAESKERPDMHQQHGEALEAMLQEYTTALRPDPATTASDADPPKLFEPRDASCLISKSGSGCEHAADPVLPPSPQELSMQPPGVAGASASAVLEAEEGWGDGTWAPGMPPGYHTLDWSTEPVVGVLWNLTNDQVAACWASVSSSSRLAGVHIPPVVVDPAFDSGNADTMLCSLVWLVRVQAWGSGGGSDWSEPSVVVWSQLLNKTRGDPMLVNTLESASAANHDAPMREGLPASPFLQHRQEWLIHDIVDAISEDGASGDQTKVFPPHTGGYDDVHDDDDDEDFEDSHDFVSMRPTAPSDGSAQNNPTDLVVDLPPSTTGLVEFGIDNAQADFAAALQSVPRAIVQGFAKHVRRLEGIQRVQSDQLAEVAAKLQSASSSQSASLTQMMARLETAAVAVIDDLSSRPEALPPMHVSQSSRRESLERLVLAVTMIVSIATTLFYCFSVATQPLAAPDPVPVGRRPDGIITSIDDGTGEPFLVMGGDHDEKIPNRGVSQPSKPASAAVSLGTSGRMGNQTKTPFSWILPSQKLQNAAEVAARAPHKRASFLASRGIYAAPNRSASAAGTQIPSTHIGSTDSASASTRNTTAVSRRVVGAGMGSPMSPPQRHRLPSHASHSSSPSGVEGAAASFSTPHGQWPAFYARDTMPTAQVSRMQRAVVRAIADTAETTFERSAPDRCFICDGEFRLRAIRNYRARHSCRQCARSFCGECGTIGHLPLLPCGNRCLCDACLHHNEAFAVDDDGIPARLNLDQLPPHVH